MIIITLILTIINIIIMLKNLKSNEDIKSIEKTINAKLDYLMSMEENNCNTPRKQRYSNRKIN